MVSTPVRGCAAVHRYVERICFKTGPPQRVGAELEWIVASSANPRRHVPIDLLRDIVGDAAPLPGGSVVSYEPGGQVELSSSPGDGLSACWRALDADVRLLERSFGDAGLVLLPTAIDPYRVPRRQIGTPRYDAMEAYFDRRGWLGRIMMCSTAATQVNLDAGRDEADVAWRWRVLHTVGPALVAAFANSPVFARRRTGWKSARQAVWLTLDPRRTRTPTGPTPAEAWSRYALAAPIMAICNDGDRWLPDPGLTFEAWLDGRAPYLRAPTEDDLAYHLTTLFPPVRPRGWLEVRYVDAQAPHYWAVPLAVLVALTGHPAAGELAVRAAAPVAHAWLAAARHGLDHPGLARAAERCLRTAVDALGDLTADPALVDLVESYLDQYVARGRCPADDIQQEATA